MSDDRTQDGAAIAASLHTIITTLYALPDEERCAVLRAVNEIVQPFEAVETFAEKVAAAEPIVRPIVDAWVSLMRGITVSTNHRAPPPAVADPYPSNLRELLLAIETSSDDTCVSTTVALINALWAVPEWRPFVSNLRTLSSTQEQFACVGLEQLLSSLAKSERGLTIEGAQRAVGAIRIRFAAFREQLRPVRPA